MNYVEASRFQSMLWSKVLLDVTMTQSERLTLRKKCPDSELFWSARIPKFSRIRTEYGEILRISPYSVIMRKNEDQNNSEYRHFLRSLKLSVATKEGSSV